MLFPTIEFGIFFLFVFIISWILIKTAVIRKYFLVTASFIFYGLWSINFLGLLILSCIFNYAIGFLIDNSRNEKGKKLKIILGVGFNILYLCIFKYYNFFADSINSLFQGWKLNTNLTLLQIITPIGISFYTFQAISYLIDIYREEIKAQSLLNVIFYISFFPQILSGPIIKAGNFFNNIISMPDRSNIKILNALGMFLSGLFKKLIIANYISVLLVGKVFENPQYYSNLEVLVAIWGYAIQIFCDFSAYSDMAISVALLLGYEYPMNFNQPYSALTVQDFWKRWHISLSSWLMNYIFYPLQLKFRSLKHLGNAAALLITFFICGIWHGAAITFIVWGVLHGLAIIFEKFIIKIDKNKIKNRYSKIIATAITFNFVCASWVIFRSPDLQSAISIFSALNNWTFNPGKNILTPFITVLLIIGFSLNFISKRFKEKIEDSFFRLPIFVQGVLIGIGFIIITSMGPAGVPDFIYFKF